MADSTVKVRLEGCLQELLAPIRLRRQQLENDRGYILQMLKRGTQKAREIAAQTKAEVKSALGLNYF